MPNQKKQHRDAVYKLYVDLTQTLKQALSEASSDELQEALSGYMALMDPPENAEEVTLSPDDMKQTGLLAAQALARQLYERTKK